MANETTLRAVKYEKTAKDDPDTSKWDADAAEGRVRKWASSDNSGDPDTMDWAKYRRAFTWSDPEDENAFGGYKLPHHDIEDGKLTTVWRGVAAAMGALMGARGGIQMPMADKRACHDHLASHYKEFDREAPSMSAPLPVGKRAIFLSDTPLVLQEADDGKIRSTVQLMKGGDFKHPDFPEGLHFNRDFFDRLVKAFDDNAVGREVLVDADHFSSVGWGSSEAYGWIESIEAHGRGKQDASLWTNIRWTPLGQQAIKDEVYKYTSVEAAFDYVDEYGEAHGPAVVAMALTNRPFLRGMKAVTLNAQEYPDYWTPDGIEDTEPPRAAWRLEGTMGIFDRLLTRLKDAFREQGQEPTDDELVERLFAHFRNAVSPATESTEPDAGKMRAAISRALELLLSEEEALAALAIVPATESNEPPAEKEPDMAETNVDLHLVADERVATLTALVETQAGKIDLLTTEVQHLADERDIALADRRLDAARKLGKLSPAMEETWARDLARKDPEGFEKIVASLPAMKELLPETGVIAARDDDDDAAARLADPQKAFSAKVWELVAAEKIPYETAYIRLKAEDPELYIAYARARGIGGQRRN